MTSTRTLSEQIVIELKAKVDTLDTFRTRLLENKAELLSKLRQVDTYFQVPRGRLKLREVEGEEGCELIYYEREDILGPKGDAVFILDLSDSKTFKRLLKRVLDIKTVVRKVREAYSCKGVQVHLDDVEALGSFIEFEIQSSSEPERNSLDRRRLEELRRRLGISPKNLVKGSYSDLM